MPALIGQGVTLRGLRSEDFSYTMALAAASSFTAADVGIPVALDTTADNTVKVAGDGDTIFGFLGSYENRVQEGVIVGTIYRKGVFSALYTGTIPARGAGVVGSATRGKVKAAAGAVVNNIVVEQAAAATEVVVIFD
jgi:hypothetical protein